jgi:hypothetical protein
VVGGSVPTAGAAAAEDVIGGREEADKSSGDSSAGNQGGFGVGGKVAMGISVKRGARIVRVGAVQESVGEGADTAEMVEGGRKEKHILVNKRLDDGLLSPISEDDRSDFGERESSWMHYGAPSSPQPPLSSKTPKP